MRLLTSLELMREARLSLGNPAELREAIVATGIDALFYLMEGGTVEMADGRMMKLVQVNPEGEQR